MRREKLLELPHLGARSSRPANTYVLCSFLEQFPDDQGPLVSDGILFVVTVTFDNYIAKGGFVSLE